MQLLNLKKFENIFLFCYDIFHCNLNMAGWYLMIWCETESAVDLFMVRKPSLYKTYST